MIDHYFIRPEKINHERNLEGQIVRDGIVVLGWKIGKDSHLSNLIHEMCHFVEIDRARMNQNQWGLRYGKLYEFPHHLPFFEMTTYQDVEREARVWGMQCNVMEKWMGSGSVDMSHFARTSLFLNGFPLVPGKSSHQKIKWVQGRIMEAKSQFPIDWFDREWFDRVSCL